MTLVSYDHGFIFLKTRKTAGTSVEMFLQPFCTPPGHPVEEWGEAIVTRHGIVGQRLGVKGRRVPPPDPDLRDTWFSHQAAARVKKQLPWHVWLRYEKISVVRNPFRKVLSGYFWQHRNKPRPDDIGTEIARFRRFARERRFNNDRGVVFIKDRFVPNTLIRAEHLQDDLEALARRLRLDTSRTRLPVTKSSGDHPRRVPLEDWYDGPSRDAVREELAWMFEKGGYRDDPARTMPDNMGVPA
ncbi:sulfotransferase family protein [Roseovarius salinarum]|uniref:hypothetical protein n=1 Tax=Roseovarius salinarum TaxID=1981892 RepID=UPI000C3223C0|nr:hypothetical protein [Roseovarius salinarum]